MCTTLSSRLGVYRAAWSNNKALDLLQRESGIEFDPRCVVALVNVVSRENVAVRVA